MARCHRAAGVLAAAAVLALSACGETVDTSGLPTYSPPASRAGGTAAEPTAAPTTGGSSAVPTAQQLGASMTAAVRAAKSGRLAGTFVVEKMPWAVDVWGTTDGGRGQARIIVGAGRADLVVVGATAYVRGDAALLTLVGLTSAQAKALTASGKWARTPATALGDDRAVLSVPGFVAEVTKGLAGRKAQRARSTSVAGVPCWAVDGLFGSNPASTCVAKATSLPIRTTITINGTQRPVSFSAWKAAPTVSVPPAAQIAS